MPDETDNVCDLSDKHCAACTGATPKLSLEEIIRLHLQTPTWTLFHGGTEITREFAFRNFAGALAFVNQVSTIAEEEGHHPDILIHKWKLVRLTVTTHAIRALSENDFILAAKIDRLVAENPLVVK